MADTPPPISGDYVAESFYFNSSIFRLIAERKTQKSKSKNWRRRIFPYHSESSPVICLSVKCRIAREWVDDRRHGDLLQKFERTFHQKTSRQGFENKSVQQQGVWR